MSIDEVLNSPKNLSRVDLLFEQAIGSYASIKNLQMLSGSIIQTLVHLGGRYNVRTFLEEDIEIPIYHIPVQQRVRAC